MITLNNIYSDITIQDVYSIEEEIYKYFYSDFVINKIMCSPLREDKNPSFIFFKGKNGRLLWHDYTGISGDVVKFVMIKTNRTYSESLQLIKTLFFSSGKSNYQIPIYNKPPIEFNTSITNWTIVNQPFNYTDFKYWNEYNISLETLLHFDIAACKYFEINGKIIKQYNKYNPLYSFKLTNDLWKLYAPFTKYFRTNVKDNYLMGYNQLPLHGDFLI